MYVECQILIYHVLMILIWGFTINHGFGMKFWGELISFEFIIKKVSKMGSLGVFLRKPQVHLDKYIAMAMWHLCRGAIRGQWGAIRLGEIYVLIMIW